MAQMLAKPNPKFDYTGRAIGIMSGIDCPRMSIHDDFNSQNMCAQQAETSENLSANIVLEGWDMNDSSIWSRE